MNPGPVGVGELKAGPATDGRVRASAAGQYAQQMLSTISSSPDKGEAANGGARCSMSMRPSRAVPWLGDDPPLPPRPHRFRCEPLDQRPRCGRQQGDAGRSLGDLALAP